jgi:formylglycine-generating enzyme required for sulfatase activity
MHKLSGFFIAAFCLMWAPTQTQAADQGKTDKALKSQPGSKAGKVFRDCPDCPEMVVIPAGSFDMGSPDSEEERDDDEGPVHRVKVAAFALGTTEITRGQFAAFVKETGYDTGDRCWTLADGKFQEREGDWRKPGFWQNDKHPVTCISWNDAQAYAKWISRKTGKQYRLPTEAEWEYAARGKTRSSRYWGDNPDKACKFANVSDRTAKAKIPGSLSWLAHECADNVAFTASVGSFRANAFGLKDMLGNVWEWTEDCYQDSYEGAFANGGAWQEEGAKRVLRGGSWNSDPQNVRAAIRNSDRQGRRFSFFGFRLARKL